MTSSEGWKSIPNTADGPVPTSSSRDKSYAITT
jgi:hypothetical protein